MSAMGISEFRKSRGYTLVEIMVAMVIALIVLGGVYQTIVRENVDMDREIIILDMQNNARVAIDRITREIRRTGFVGCGGDLAVNTLNNQGASTTLLGTKTSAVGLVAGPDYWRGLDTMLTELKNGTTVDYLGVPFAFHNNAAASHPLYDEGTDAISLVALGGDVAQDPAQIMVSGIDPVYLKDKAFTKGDILLITDCKDYSIFQKSNCANTLEAKRKMTEGCGSESPPLIALNVSDDTDLGKAYGNEAPARVYNLQISTFFVSGSELVHNKNGRSVALNIEDLQFEFITDTDNDKDLSDETWSLTAAVPGDVRAIRVSVLAMSEVVNGYNNPATYNYAGKSYTPNDQRYRYLTSAAVYLRNAGI